MGENVAAIASAIGLVLQPVFLVYFLLYNGYLLLLIALSAKQVRRRVAGHFIEDLDLIDAGDYTKPLTMIVPAFNEEVTIVDSVTNLVHCDYPRFEVVVVNDGSSDRTLEVLKQAFRLRRTDLPVPRRHRDGAGTSQVPRDRLAAAQCFAARRARQGERRQGRRAQRGHQRVDGAVLREPGRRQHPRPAGPQGTDADGAGGSAHRRGGRAGGDRQRLHHPGRAGSERGSAATHPWSRFQMVEYLRSFTTGRTGLDRLDSILILSGVFAVFEKETVIRAGGYLTPLVQHRLVAEYVGGSAGTVCEDMEIIVRLHRFVRDKNRRRRIAFLPHPVAWTEVPERLESLRKQRGRWYRGLRESLFYHRDMLFRRKYGRIGWFALPTFWLFEYYGPVLEALGYLFVIVFLIMELIFQIRILNEQYAVAFLLASLGWGTLVNVFAVLVGAWRFRYGLADRLQRGLLPFTRKRDVLTLLGYAVLENFFWRFLTLYWRLRGLWDAWRGKSGWEKFARQGFQKHPEAVRAA